MLKTDAYRPEPLYASLAEGFADPVAAASFPMAQMRWRHQRWADRVGLGGLSDGAWEAHFARFEPLPGNLPRPLAMRYHGHQFRVYNPDIGDGRGFLFAQLRDDRGRLLDLGTKGSGQTPYSRFGDGRLTLKGGVREVLAAHMLEALGVPTSKAFSLFETGEELQRQDEPSPTRSSVLVRLQHSHIRIGTFQRFAYLEDTARLRQLIDHCAEAYYPHLLGVSEGARPAAFLEAVVAATARLAACWMAAGFVHGVLNTDNFNVTGESFDYGPWRFLPKSEPGFTAAYFDHAGLYAFGRQPEQASWTMARLAESLLDIAPQEDLERALGTFAQAYRAALREAVFARLGIAPGPDEEADLGVLQELFSWMTETGADWGQFFHDWFCAAAGTDRAAASPQAEHYAAPAFAPLRDALLARDPVRPERLAHALWTRSTPPNLLIDAVEGLWAAIAASDDWNLFNDKIREIDVLREGLDIVIDPPREA
jgi:uncharacterized protein YdiU (UPF0061 family)